MRLRHEWGFKRLVIAERAPIFDVQNSRPATDDKVHRRRPGRGLSDRRPTARAGVRHRLLDLRAQGEGGERHARPGRNDQFINGTREILRTGPDAYYRQSGAEAINGAAATIEKLTKLKDQIFGRAGNDYQRVKLRPIFDTHFAVSADAVAKHANDQQAAYGRTMAATAIKTSQADAVANPANLPNAVARAEGAARASAEGEAPEVVESRVRTAATSVICAVIGDQLERSDPERLAQFRQYRDQLDPRDRRVLGAAAEMLTSTIAAADWLCDRSATLAVAPAPSGGAALDAVNVASASMADPPPVTSWGGKLLQQEGVAGHRRRVTEIEDRRRALTALNEQEFAGHPVRLRQPNGNRDRHRLEPRGGEGGGPVDPAIAIEWRDAVKFALEGGKADKLEAAPSDKHS